MTRKRTLQSYKMNSTTRLAALLAVCFLGIVQAQVALEGACPDLDVMPNFNVPKYMGLWYEVVKYPTIFESGGKCITAQYELLENGTVRVLNSQYNVNAESDIEIEGTAVALENAKLLVQFPGQPIQTESNYWVLETDYVNYSVVFSCRNTSSNSRLETVWVLTRNRDPSMDTMINALVVLTSNNISLNYLKITDQEDC